MQNQRLESPCPHQHALSLARELETLLAKTHASSPPPRARVAKALAQSLIDEIAALDPTHDAA